MVNNFLFELGSEELPSAAVFPFAESIAAHFKTALDKVGVSYAQIKAYATPRRLAVFIENLEEEPPAQKQIRRGPALLAAYDGQGQPTPALKGFADSCGVTIEELSHQKTDKGEWLIYESCVTGVKTADLLPMMALDAVKALPIAKPMRWGDGALEFVRPVHWVVMLYGAEILPATLLGLTAGRETRGHRFHAPESISLQQANDYVAALQKAYVIADFAKRRNLIRQKIEEAAIEVKAQPIIPDALLDEVTSIVEWPVILTARFEPKFLEVPAEALIASMQVHQKCFALQGCDGRLLPLFIAVSNLQSRQPEQVIAGNEKVMRARLSDANFFFLQDKKQSLSHHLSKTGEVLFQAKLGSLLGKTTRMQTIMAYLCTVLDINKQHALRAAELSKCDLMTGMVGEFPELQGIMGHYYALNDGEDPETAQALEEQYLPRFAADRLPESLLGSALSLAERLDTLVGIFAIGQKPNKDKDPFKLRRHALAVVRLLINNPWPLQLSVLIEQALSAYGPLISNASNSINELQEFILERLQSYYQGSLVSIDKILAVKARQTDDLYDFDNRVKALAEFVKLPEAASLSAACKRVRNLLQKENLSQPSLNEALFEADAEKRLFNQLISIERVIKPLYAEKKYVSAFQQLATLRAAVNDFFENVMVMVDDPAIKSNRLSLLARLQDLLQGPADISLLNVTQA